MINPLQPDAAQRTSHDRPPDGNEGPTSHRLLAIVDASLCGVVFVAPYFFGGRHDLGRLVLLIFIAVAAGAWFARQALLPSAKWIHTAAHGLILLAVLLVVAQLVPLPTAWVDAISPRTAQLLPLWKDGGVAAPFGAWHTLSLIPHETAKSLAMLLGYSLLFMVVAQRIRDVADVRRMLQWIALSALVMACFGLMQFFTSDGRYFWFYQLPHRTTSYYLTGSFANRNHCAHFLVLGIGPLVAWLVAATRAKNSRHGKTPSAAAAVSIAVPLLAVALAVVMLAILLTLSRGGAAAMVIALAVTLALYWRRGLLDTKYLYGLAGLVMLVIAMLSVYGYDSVVARLHDLTEGSFEVIDPDEGRRVIWRANIDAIRAGWLSGTGAGSHRDIYPVYLQQPLPMEYTHAESGYLQVATENGLPGAVLLVAGINLCGYWCVSCYRRARKETELLLCGAIATGLIASVVHSAVDFVWYIPACLSITVILAACALRLSQISLPHEIRARTHYFPGRPAWVALATIALLAGTWTVYTFVGPGMAAIHWDRYLRAAAEDALLSRVLLSKPNTSSDDQATRPQRPLSEVMIRQLEHAVHWDPQCARAHARLADRYMTQFELGLRDQANMMEISQIRDAAVASAFSSEEKLRGWLTRAFSADSQLLYRALDHARQAVELCPLQGDAYLYLADLCFLQGADYPAVQAYVEQGLRVCPYDKAVLYRAGVQALSLGHLEGTLALWSKCYHVRGIHQSKIIYRLVASGMPASLFLSTFEPDWQTLREVWQRYRQFGSNDDLQALLSYAASVTQREAQQTEGPQLAAVWYWQSLLYADVGQSETALACLQHAYRCNPHEFSIRHAIGHALVAAGRYAEAEPHIRWCLARHPQDSSLSNALVKIAKDRLAERERKESISPPAIGGWRQ